MSALLALRGQGEELQAAHGARPAVHRADVLRPAHRYRSGLQILTTLLLSPHAMVSKRKDTFYNLLSFSLK